MKDFYYNSTNAATSSTKAIKATVDIADAQIEATNAKNVGVPSAMVQESVNMASASVDSCKETVDNIAKFINQSIETVEEAVARTRKEFKDALLEYCNNKTEENANALIEAAKAVSMACWDVKDNNSQLPSTNDPINDLIANGMPEDIAKNLSTIMCEALSHQFYTREGAVNAAYMYIGTLAAYNLRLEYFSNPGWAFCDTGDFYFGTGEGNNRLIPVDCVNMVKLILRSVGIDPAATTFPYYAMIYDENGNLTSGSWEGPGSEGFTKGKPGDFLTNKCQGHIMMIVGTDIREGEEGYWYIEEANGAQLQFKTFRQLASETYGVTDATALYNNSTAWLENAKDPKAKARLNPFEGYAGRYGNNGYIPPDIYFANFPNLSEEAKANIQAAFEKNNTWKNLKELTPSEIEELLSKKTAWSLPPAVTISSDTPPDVIEGTIFPDSSYIDGLPPLDVGVLGYSEISSHHILYEVNNITKEIYENYIATFESAGYVLSEDGTMWIKGEYMLTVEMTDEDTMMIMLQTMFGGRVD